MPWPWLKHGDVAGILLIAVALGIVVLVLVFHPGLGQRQNFGLSPDWQCARIEKGEPICVRLLNPDGSK